MGRWVALHEPQAKYKYRPNEFHFTSFFLTARWIVCGAILLSIAATVNKDEQTVQTHVRSSLLLQSEICKHSEPRGAFLEEVARAHTNSVHQLKIDPESGDFHGEYLTLANIFVSVFLSTISSSNTCLFVWLGRAISRLSLCAMQRWTSHTAIIALSNHNGYSALVVP